MMTRKDFENLAKDVRAVVAVAELTATQREILIAQLSGTCKESNPRFDSVRFAEACRA